MAAPSKSWLSSGPFVLFDDARSDGAPARLYRDPVEIVSTQDPAEVPVLLDRLGRGGDWAGFLTYEAGLALEPKLAHRLRPADLPLLWFARFDAHDRLSEAELTALLPPADGGWAGTPRPRLSRADYTQALDHVQALIEAGDIYQANLTLRSDVSLAGSPLAIYAGLRQRARAGFGGIVWTGADWFLSLSPELFFALKDGKVTTKPMKGTATRGQDAAQDAARVDQLRHDPKQRAENLMIVDLLRNDLSRVACPGTVEVPQLFTVESYPTVHQMISTVTARLTPETGVADLIAAIYPCGSITGAPKIRAMEIIDAVETGPRGIYTGSIGRVDGNGDAAFNVAIRTLHVSAGAATGTLGLGGGIVADSRVAEEWEECLAKGRFVADQRCFDLIETMRFDPQEGLAWLDLHLARLAASAAALDVRFDRHAVRNALQAATLRLDTPRRVRLLVSRTGQVALEIGPLPAPPQGPVQVTVAPLPVDPADFRLRHKTTDRAFYDVARQAGAGFETIFVDPDGWLTEGSFTNIFVQKDGLWLTPPATRGLLPGVLRAAMLRDGSAQEADLRCADLADGFYIGNALRGLMPAQLA